MSPDEISTCLKDEDQCKSRYRVSFDGNCALSPVKACTVDGDCTWVAERCLDGVCQAKPCSCPTNQSSCQDTTCDMPGESCEHGYCETPYAEKRG